ncbi:DUF7594 domain-containing protein [Pontiella agarivorans]|uniref:DNRLRE domain-containing protein n=1 Tax=Pontiella agarivorans TaxID=3038953 RepID=A0ABU5MSG9_9BACT|nr:DNRLRE domain-containing protein [Pontiella agarivorans]MDZ8117077.1 DNRLRE domain-containing protein [Pontiella agarivorans]
MNAHKWMASLLVLWLAGMNAEAFYDPSCETHAVVTNVMDFGAVGDGVVNDSAAFQAAIDSVTANGGGDVDVPEGTYLLKGIRLKSNVHLRVDSSAVLNLDVPTDGSSGGTMITIDGHPDWLENSSVQGVGGKFTVNFPEGSKGTRFIQVKKARNFLLSDFHVNGNLSAYSSVVFGPSGFDEATRGMPTQGTMRNVSISNSEYGYGLIQSQACDSILFTNLHANGGVALRMETGWDKMGNLQYGGVFNVVGRNISAENAKAAVMMAPVGLQQGLVDIDGVYATNCASAVQISAGGLRNLYNPDIFPGTYAEGSSVRNVTAVFGMSAQYKKMPDEYPSEFSGLFSNVSHSVYGAPIIGPSLSAVNNSNERVTIENVKTYGFDYVPPIQGDGYAQTAESFTATNYTANMDGDFWAATANLNAGGTNWISGDGAVGRIDLTTAEAENHALNYWGFALEAGEDATIASDFRYFHQSGGDLSGNLNEAAFGLLFSTDPDPAIGADGYCLLGNKGNGIGLVEEALSLIAHTNLNVDTASGGWSDWFRLKWTIERGDENYRGTPSIYDESGMLIYSGSTIDLGVANGTEIWAGYTTGTNRVGGRISDFSGLEQVEADNFVFEVSYINEAPIWLDTPSRFYATVDTEYTTSLRGAVLEPNGKLVKYTRLQGPDWLTVEADGWITGMPDIFDIGPNIFELVATDYEGLSSTNTVIVTVASSSGGMFSVPPVEDTYVQGLNPTNNYGSSRTMGLQDHAVKQRIAYLKFDLSQIPGDQLTNAFLRLKVSDPDPAMHQTVWSVADDSWQEDTVTYSNRPALVSGVSGAPVPVPDFGWWAELNVTGAVQGEWAGDQTVSLALVASNGFQTAYHSSDDMPGHRPELVVQTVQTNNTAPVFTESPMDGGTALIHADYTFSLSDFAVDEDGDELNFRIVSGPEWLVARSDGVLTGTPNEKDSGWNRWEVLAADGINPAVTGELNIWVEENDSELLSILNPVADTYVQGGTRSNNNYGTESTVSCKYKSNNENWTYEPYLRFDLSAVSGASITNATLRLKVQAIDDVATSVHTAYFVADDSWGETNLTWNTKPLWSTSLDAAPRPSSAGLWIELDVTQQVSAEWLGDGLFSVALIASTKDKVDYYSREALSVSDRPQLVIQAIGSEHSAWNAFISDYGLGGLKNNHSDSDGLDDWGEYVFGGNPTNPADTGTQPVFDAASSNYIFSLIGDDHVVAHVLTNADLVGGNWGTNATVNVTATNGVLGAYTNRVNMETDELFIKLLVE